ncbi:DUF397 domain-containing protein [Embleya sp. NPDC020630]|uniref:DUF397 domain-containing protein n=1 Tax=Embleya sp. NPDC020630 TaxID=3363979 RepID=UPI003788410F
MSDYPAVVEHASELGVVAWVKATASNETGSCVEVANLGSVAGVRDSKLADGPAFTVDGAAWSAFLARVQ